MQVVRAVIFHSGARDEIRALPKELRYRLGRALMALQLGYRKHPKGILVLRAFRKKTEQTPQSEILLTRRRLREMLDGGT